MLIFVPIRYFTMKRHLFLYFLIIVFASFSLSAEVTVGDMDALNAVTVTSSKKLNMRAGPSSSAGIVCQLQPGETVWVTDVSDYANGWVKVNTGNYSGFVSTGFIQGRNGDYYQYVLNPSSTSDGKNTKDTNISQYLGPVNSFFIAFFSLPLWIIILVCGALITGEVFTIRWLKDRYYFHQSPATLYFIIVPTFLVVGMILMVQPLAKSSREAAAIWILLLMCFVPLLVHACWRLEQNGKIQNRQYRSGCSDATIGKTLGIIAALLFVLPLSSAIYTVTDEILRNTIGLPDKFWVMLVTMAVISGVNFGVVHLWFLIIEKFLMTLANFTVMMISACLFFIIIMAELDIVNDFNGFNYVVALLGMFFNVCLFAGFFKALRTIRCARCHHFAGDLSGVTDQGYSTTSSDSWHDISDSSINSSNIVRNARELRRTYTTMHNWTNHYTCDYCSNTWSMSESEQVHSETHALKRRWDEYS